MLMYLTKSLFFVTTMKLFEKTEVFIDFDRNTSVFLNTFSILNTVLFLLRTFINFSLCECSRRPTTAQPKGLAKLRKPWLSVVLNPYSYFLVCFSFFFSFLKPLQGFRENIDSSKEVIDFSKDLWSKIKDLLNRIKVFAKKLRMLLVKSLFSHKS